jgi:hypothetical protein
VNEPHCLHLLVTERETLAEGHRYGTYMAICGELLVTEELPSSDCEPGCQREITYCQACIRTAIERNYDAGADIDCPPGVIVRRQR